MLLGEPDAQWYRNAIVVAGGPGPRGCDHAVLYRDGSMLHDPHPSRAGLLSVEDVTILIPIDPMGITRSFITRNDDFGC